MSWTVGVDVGGTFTDFCAIDESTGEIHVGKTPSTPDNPARAIVDGLRALSDRFGFALSTVSRLSHGTTVGTKRAHSTTRWQRLSDHNRWFRDLLEIGRQTRPHMFDLYMDHPQPLVPRERRIELNERRPSRGSHTSTLRGRHRNCCARGTREWRASLPSAACSLFATPRMSKGGRGDSRHKL